MHLGLAADPTAVRPRSGRSVTNYLFHCDPVVGTGHFRTSVWKGLEIIEGLRGHVSGLGVPTYVVDGLHGGKQDSADAELPGFGQRQRGDLAQL